jgi:HSP20 family protein
MQENGNTATLDEAPQACVAPAGQKRGCRSFVPAVDIVENSNEILVQADVPGAAPGDLDISFENGLLTVHARVEKRQASDQVKYLTREYGVGDFHRQFKVADGIDASKIEAEVRNGVLTLRLPKAEEVKPRKIDVKAA